MKQLFALVVMLAAPLPAMAQVMVSTMDGNGIAYTCFVSAKLSVFSPGHAARDIGNCHAALDQPMNPKTRAATFDNRGILYNAMKNYTRAMSDFDNSIRLDPTLGDPWLNRGVAKIMMKQPQDALADIEKGIHLGTAMMQVAYYDRGIAHMELGHTTEAYYDFKRAQTTDPTFMPAVNALKDFTVVRQPVSQK